MSFLVIKSIVKMLCCIFFIIHAWKGYMCYINTALQLSLGPDRNVSCSHRVGHQSSHLLTHAVLHHHEAALIAVVAVALEAARCVDAGSLATQVRRDPTLVDIWTGHRGHLIQSQINLNNKLHLYFSKPNVNGKRRETFYKLSWAYWGRL